MTNDSTRATYEQDGLFFQNIEFGGTNNFFDNFQKCSPYIAVDSVSAMTTLDSWVNQDQIYDYLVVAYNVNLEEGESQ